jgi:hypothetical protein
MAKSAKKRGENTSGKKRVSKDRVVIGINNFEIVNRLWQK